MHLSILIPTIVQRKDQCYELVTYLENQIRQYDPASEIAEVLIFSDNASDWTIGNKRNILIEEALGEYVCFVDDDDWVPDYYISKILDTIVDSKKNNEALDCIGIRGRLFCHSTAGTLLYEKDFLHSIKYDKYMEDINIYYRPPNHLCPIRKDIASKYRFPSINFGEDTDWAMKMQKDSALKKEKFIDDVMYHYNFLLTK